MKKLMARKAKLNRYESNSVTTNLYIIKGEVEYRFTFPSEKILDVGSRLWRVEGTLDHPYATSGSRKSKTTLGRVIMNVEGMEGVLIHRNEDSTDCTFGNLVIR